MIITEKAVDAFLPADEICRNIVAQLKERTGRPFYLKVHEADMRTGREEEAMSTKTYLLNVRLMKSNFCGLATDEQKESALSKYKQRLATLSAELVAAGVSDGTYTEPYYPNFWANHEFVVTDARSAALIAEKFSSAVYVAKPGGGKHFLFESERSVPTWLFREVTATQRAFNVVLAEVTRRLEYLLSIEVDPEQIKLLRAIESNIKKATTVEQLSTIQGRLEFHRGVHPEWRWCPSDIK